MENIVQDNHERLQEPQPIQGFGAEQGYRSPAKENPMFSQT
jgi:hypothetical protein